MGLFGKKCSLCGSKSEVEKLSDTIPSLAYGIASNKLGSLNICEVGPESDRIEPKLLQFFISKRFFQDEYYCSDCVTGILDNNNIEWRPL